MKPTQNEKRYFIGYDRSGYQVGDRVEIHPGTDLWMRGARFGVVVGCSLTLKDAVRVRLDAIPGIIHAGTEDTFKFVSEGTR